MISAAAIPRIDGDMDALAGHARGLGEFGAAFADTRERTAMLSNSPQRLVEIVRGITSESVEERRVWAEVPGDLSDYGELRGDEVAPLAAVLAWAALVETHVLNVRERLLYSLSSLVTVPAETLELVTSGLSRGDLDIAEVEFYDALVAKLDEHHGRSPQV